jgi:hypothetical protein
MATGGSRRFWPTAQTPFDARQPQSGRLRIRPHRCVFGLTNVSVKSGHAQAPTCRHQAMRSRDDVTCSISAASLYTWGEKRIRLARRAASIPLRPRWS